MVLSSSTLSFSNIADTSLSFSLPSHPEPGRPGLRSSVLNVEQELVLFSSLPSSLHPLTLAIVVSEEFDS